MSRIGVSDLFRGTMCGWEKVPDNIEVPQFKEKFWPHWTDDGVGEHRYIPGKGKTETFSHS